MELEIIIGEQVRLIREHRNLTQTELADKADVSTRYIGYIERGKKLFSIPTAARIAEALDVPVFLFFVEAGDYIISIKEHNELIESAQDIERSLSALFAFIHAMNQTK